MVTEKNTWYCCCSWHCYY